MEFNITDTKYTLSSGSLSNIITEATYEFRDSGSGVGSDSGSLYVSHRGGTQTLLPPTSSSFKSFSSVTEDDVKSWVEHSFVSQSGAGNWGEWTGSLKTRISSSIAERISPSERHGLPW